MYDIKQFKLALYVVLLLGLTGFSLAVEAPGLWVGAGVIMGLHAWLVTKDRFRPLPRMVANVITLLALLLTFQAVRFAVTPIITIGQFLVFLQLVKLYELRANRDYAQLLVLSLLLMVAGAISTPSLLFGVLLIVYLFLALYVCLLFHLKVENDHALAAQAVPRERLNDATVKQDQRYLPRSMRKLAGLVSVASVAMAVVVFLFFPRGSGAGMFGQLQLQRPAMTGFAEQVSFNSITNISQNNAIVAHVQLWKNGRLVPGNEQLMLRGRTLDQYDIDTQKWARLAPEAYERDATANVEVDLLQWNVPPGDEYRQKVSLQPTGTSALFALPGAYRFMPARTVGRIIVSADDGTLQLMEQQGQRFDYEVVSRNAPMPAGAARILNRFRARGGPRPARTPEQGRQYREANIAPRIAEYARRPEVGGVDDAGQPLAAIRPVAGPVTALDERIAANIERHLQANFSYTLDLTGEKKDEARDPNEQFLYDWKKGHCEYFASAMVLMCQSLGMQARLVTGFKVTGEDYDATYGDYYIVRQSHAHAWVEVRTPDGWKSFDPTSGREAAGGGGATAWRQVKNFFNWLEYKWAEKVVAYDGERREDLIQGLDEKMAEVAGNPNLNPRRLQRKMRTGWRDWMRRFTQWLNDGTGLMFSARIVMGVIGVLVLVLVYGASSLILQRYRMRRRAARIGLDNLPTGEAIRLAKQLGFYERLMTLLARRHIVRPRHVTPAEFTDGLAFLPNEAYDAIRRLTHVFYAIRFGGERLDREGRERLEAAVDALEPVLDAALPAR